jgi:hypothetical protein
MKQADKIAMWALVVSLIALGFTAFEMYTKYVKSQRIIVTVINPAFANLFWSDEFNVSLVFTNDGNDYSTIFDNQLVIFQDENKLISCLDSVKEKLISNGFVYNASSFKSTQSFVLKPDEQISVNITSEYFIADTGRYFQNGINPFKPVNVGFLISYINKDGERKSKLIPFGSFNYVTNPDTSEYPNGHAIPNFLSVKEELNGTDYIKTIPFKGYIKTFELYSAFAYAPIRRIKVIHPHSEILIDSINTPNDSTK